MSFVVIVSVPFVAVFWGKHAAPAATDRPDQAAVDYLAGRKRHGIDARLRAPVGLAHEAAVAATPGTALRGQAAGGHHETCRRGVGQVVMVARQMVDAVLPA